MRDNRDVILIFANGAIDDMEVAAEWLGHARVVIAADGGLRHVSILGRRPDVLIGDLDSLPPGMESVSEWEDVQVIRHPADKDETDLELALLHAAERYLDAELVILGGFGGRLDHTLANILLLAHPALVGRAVRFVEGRETAWLITGESAITGRAGDTVSLIPLGGPARVAATTGLRWPLRDEMLAFGPARGISNEMTAGAATIRLASGMVLCVHAAGAFQEQHSARH